MRFPLRAAAAVREALGQDIPMSVRLSSVDGLEGGWTLDDSIAFSRELKAIGADIIDCSSGGITGPATAARVAIPRGPGYQVPFADAIRKEVGIPTIAVGLITDPAHAESILNEGKADIIAIGRQALQDPNWPLNAALALGVDPEFNKWPVQHGWWLARRAGIPPAAWPGNT
jgi:2,4-dienoyl-CoA reductase-like NADH-dependent reductase (Old Yellow Enzyme family)